MLKHTLFLNFFSKTNNQKRLKTFSYGWHFNAEAALVKSLAKINALSICQSTTKWLVPKIWLIDTPNAMDVIKK